MASALLAAIFLSGSVPATRLEYDLSVAIRPEMKRLEVEGSLVLPPQTGAYRELAWGLGEGFEVESLESETAAGRRKLAVKGAGRAANVRLPEEVAPGNPLKLRFRLRSPEKPGFVFYVGADCAFACGTNTLWYPVAGPIIGGKRPTSLPLVLGRMRFESPPGWIVIATGRRMSTPEAISFVAEKPCDLGFVAGPFVAYPAAGASKVPVSVYRLKPDANAPEFAAGLNRVVDELSRVFGPFPFPEFGVVEIPNSAAAAAQFGGVAMAGLMVGGDSFFEGGFNTAFFGHEVGHQWWGNLVRFAGGEGSYLLSEAMAQYGSLRAVERIDGPAKAVQYKRDGYPGYIADQCAEGYFLNVGAGLDRALINLPGDGLSHTLADQKGFLVWDMLARKVGVPAFDRALRTLTRDFAFDSLSLLAFKTAVEHAGKTNLDRFWDQWLRRTGLPVVDLEWRLYAGEVEIVLSQTSPTYEIVVPVVVRLSDGTSKLHRIPLADARGVLSVKTAAPCVAVDLDPFLEVLAMDSEKKREVEAMAPAYRARRLMNDGKPEEAKRALEAALAAQTQSDPYGVRFYCQYLLASIRFNTDKKPAEAALLLEEALKAPVRRAMVLPWAFLLMARVQKDLGNREAATVAAEAAILADAKASGAAVAARNLLKDLGGA